MQTRHKDADGKKEKSDYITRALAKKEHKLSDADLAGLRTEPLLEANPLFPSGAPVQLYVKAEVLAAAAEKRETAEAEERARAARRREAAAKRRQEQDAAAAAAAAAAEAEALARRKASTAEAKAALRRMEAHRARIEAAARRGGVRLPDAALESVMALLAASMEPEGVWGPSLAARDMASASLVNWDFHRAAKAGFAALADALPDAPACAAPATSSSGGRRRDAKQAPRGLAALPGGVAWRVWDSALSEPASLSLADLKAAARVLGAKVSGTKPELAAAVRQALLSALRPAAVPRAPLKLLAAVARERTMPLDKVPGSKVGSKLKAGDAQGLGQLLLRLRRARGAADSPRRRFNGEADPWWGRHNYADATLASARASLAAEGIASLPALAAAAAAAEAVAGGADAMEKERLAELVAAGYCDGCYRAMAGEHCCNGLCEDCCHDYECNYHRGEDDDYGDYDDYW